MNEDRMQRAEVFIGMMERQVELVPRHNGYDIQKPGSSRVGFVRYNIGGRDRNCYRVYAYEPFSDPRERFENASVQSRRGWNCLVNPEDENDTRYVISVLESSYDEK